VLLNGFLNVFLTIQIKGTSRRSNETLGLNQYSLSTSTLNASLNRRTLNTVPLPYDNDFLSL
jgi:hypothetical protein